MKINYPKLTALSQPAFKKILADYSYEIFQKSIKMLLFTILLYKLKINKSKKHIYLLSETFSIMIFFLIDE